MAALLQTLDRIPAGEKVVVYSACPAVLPMLAKELGKKMQGLCARLFCDHKHVLRLDGPKRERASLVDTFRNDANCRILLLSASGHTHGTGAAGLDLWCASHVILLDEFSPDVEQQCLARIKRLVQDKKTTIWRLKAQCSIDEPLRRWKERGFAVEHIHASDLGAILEEARKLTWMPAPQWDEDSAMPVVSEDEVGEDDTECEAKQEVQTPA